MINLKSSIITFCLLSFTALNLIAQDKIMDPIIDKHKATTDLVAPWEIDATEEVESYIPGIFRDITKNGEGESGSAQKLEPEKERSFNYGYHRTLQSLNQISEKDSYNTQMQQSMKGLLAETMITAAQTQPAAAAGAHYGMMYGQLTLINQQLGHQSYFEQLKWLPNTQKAVHAMYTGCLYDAESKGMTFSEANRVCIGDNPSAAGKSGGRSEAANAKDISDHKQTTINANIQDTEVNRIYCSDLIFEQQGKSNGEIRSFREDFIKWFGDEYTVLTPIRDPSNSAAGIAKKRILPTESIMKRYSQLVRERFDDILQLLDEYAADSQNSQQVPRQALALNDNHMWKEGNVKELVGKLSIEGAPFNTALIEAIFNGWADISEKQRTVSINPGLIPGQCAQVYSGEGNTYVQEQADRVPVAKLCKQMHDYVEIVALGHIAEAVSRVQRVIIDFTSESKNSDARECGLRLIYDQLNTNDVTELQYEAVERLTQIVRYIFVERAKESGKSGGAGSTVAKTSATE